MSAQLYPMRLSYRQYMMARSALRHPVILHGRGNKHVGAALARQGYGTVEDGASGERIFRLSQAAEDAFNADDIDEGMA